MALIGTIRKNSWVLIATMVLALGGFILMDVVSNSQRYSAADATSVGKVNGQEIKAETFEQYREAMYSNAQANDYQVRNTVWNYFLENAIVRDQAEVAGLGVGRDELLDLEFGDNLSSIIQQRFGGQTGQVNVEQLNQIRSIIESGEINTDEKYAKFRSSWVLQEDEIIKQRLQEKLTNLVTKSMFAPAWQAEMAFRETNEKVDFLYVRVPYDKIGDSEVTLSDDDYASYLKDNPHLYDQQEETRTLSYVAFDVLPTSADSAAARERVEKLIPGMQGKDDSVFVVNNEGLYDATYRSKADLPAAVADRLLASPIDSVFGPYLDGGAWTIAKVLGRRVLPDSVKARHILVKSPTGKSTLDSLENLIKTGKARFDSLAIRVSEDGSASQGGDLGWFAYGRMVPEFNEVCFITGEQGKLYKVQTQFGWHLIEITGKKFLKSEQSIRAAYLTERVVPSKGTQQAVKDKAIALLAAKNLNDLAAQTTAQNLQLQTTQPLKANDFTIGILGSGKDAREVIKWAFNEETEVGEIAKEPYAFLDANGGYFDSRYVVVGLKGIAPKGAATVASLKSLPQAEQEVRNRKKADLIKSKLQNANDLGAVAGQYGVAIDTSASATMISAAVNNGGAEPRVVGAAFALAKGTVSKPIAGRSGVYVLQTTSDKSPINFPADMSLFRRQALSTSQSQVRINFMNALKKAAEVSDNRARFF